jgi:hypothetical protein
MRIGVPAETRPGETRVAATPETVKKLAAGGKQQLLVQSGAGVNAAVPAPVPGRRHTMSRQPRPYRPVRNRAQSAHRKRASS